MAGCSGFSRYRLPPNSSGRHIATEDSNLTVQPEDSSRRTPSQIRTSGSTSSQGPTSFHSSGTCASGIRSTGIAGYHHAAPCRSLGTCQLQMAPILWGRLHRSCQCRCTDRKSRTRLDWECCPRRYMHGTCQSRGIEDISLFRCTRGSLLAHIFRFLRRPSISHPRSEPCTLT